jgi:poly(3-hydroxybutyrate) depolymerase
MVTGGAAGVRAVTGRSIRVAILTASSFLFGQTGPQVITFTSDIDNSQQPYALYVPKGFDPSKKYPLVISLHGEGSTHRFSLQQLFSRENLEGRRYPEANRYFPPFPDVNVIAAAPLARGTMGYQGIAEQDVNDVIADVKRRFPIDDDRVYLTGQGMGGGGVLWLGLTRPDLWAAIAPICPEPPPDTESLAPNALNLPVRIFQGESDPLVPAESSRQWRRELARGGAPVEYTEYPHVNHAAWTLAYKDGGIFDWFAKFKRNRFPEHVHYVTNRYRYNQAYWVRLDGLETGAMATIDAQFTGPNRLSIATSNVRGFTLTLLGYPLYSSAKPLAITIDGRVVKPAPGLSFTKTAKGWQPGLFVIPAAHKRPREEGPISEGFASRHIYVYGTGGSPALDDLTARRNQALEAADWSTGRDRLQLSFRVVADKELHERDAANTDLILFGTKETNEWIARFADRMPIALNPSAADYGLVFIFPAGGRNVVVNSGLPWWTGSEVMKPPGLAFLPPRYRLVLSFPDYILFKGSLENVIAKGTFTDDRKVPPADLEKMKQTGAIATR